MQIASILSDLASLRVCDHSAALALVSVNNLQTLSTAGNDGSSVTEQDVKAEEDPDMQRATDLVELHYSVKIRHKQGEDAGLQEARKDVDRVLKKLVGKESG
ncbi:hypothetical protein MMC28_002152 [Mycoblastus sanguinarius]|nr:hypothetical protein [Mycoblastus sanguinarius]